MINNNKTLRKWQAQWIWGSSSRKPNTWMCFRKEFEVKVPDSETSSTLTKESIKAYIAADTKYWMWVNNRLTVFEGGLNRGPEPGCGYYDVVDITEATRPGINTIAILVWYWGNAGRNNVDSGEGGLLVEIETRQDVVCSDSSWKSKEHPAYGDTDEPKPSYLYGGYNIGFNAAKDIPDWNTCDLDDSNWSNAIEKGTPPCTPWGPLHERPIPQIKFTEIIKYHEYTQANTNNNSVYTAHLPWAAHVTPYLKINAPRADLKIDIHTDRYSVNGGPGDSHHQYNGHRVEYTTKKGVQQFEALNWLFGEEVIYSMPSEVEVIELGYRESGYDTEFEGIFQSDDSFLNDLHEKCKRTLYVCMRDNFMDCPDRERGQWIGDVSSQIPQTFYVLDRKADKLTSKAIRDFILWRNAGVLRGNVPGNHCGELPSQSLNAISELGMIMTYYRNSGNKEVLDFSYEAIKEYLQLWSINDNGLVVPRKGNWQWYDHGHFIDGDILENAWYYSALKAGADIAAITGHKDDEKWFNNRMLSIKNNFDRMFWKGDGYRSRDFYDDRANALAVLSGLASPDKYPVIRNILRLVRHSTPYMEYYVLEALCKMGHIADALKRMRQRYSELVSNSNSTLWEDFYVLGTRNHAWSGGPLTIMAKYIAGIDTEAPGYEVYHVLPEMADLKELDIVIPSVKGKIKVSISVQPFVFKLNHISPAGTTALVGLPTILPGDENCNIQKITCNGTEIWNKGIFQPGSESVSKQSDNNKFIIFKVSPGMYEFSAEYK